MKPPISPAEPRAGGKAGDESRQEDLDRFKDLDFEGFRRLAKDDSLSMHEKVGFPVSYREGKEEAIFADVVRKLTNLTKTGQVVVEVGPGCSGPAFMLIDLCRRQGHSLIMVDSGEMLAHLPSEPFLTKVAGLYPRDCASLLEAYAGRVDVFLTYSVLQYAYVDTNLFDFVDRSLMLLAGAGQMLVGDIPNASKRSRFLASPAGARFLSAYPQSGGPPPAHTVPLGKIDDALLAGIVLRCRSAGYEAYLMPQAPELPMANRREDLLVVRP